MAAEIKSIKIEDAALKESHYRGGSIVLVGWIDIEYFPLIKVGDYQREKGSPARLQKILKGYQEGTPFPSIFLGMRGHRVRDHDGTYYLQDPVYVMDGLQRLTGGLYHKEANPDAVVQLLAEVHFGTDEAFERQMFRTLNLDREKVNACVLLHNMRQESPATLLLYGLSHNDKTFPLNERVQWKQRMARGELISAVTYAKVAGRLHSHKAATKRNQIDELVPALDKAIETFGVQIMRENIKAFYELVDHCWGIRRVEYRGATHLKSTFLSVLAQLLSDHHDFWKGAEEKRFFIDATDRRKLAQFPMQDPQVQNLAGAGGQAAEMLYILLQNWMNKGRRSGRLKSRTGDNVVMGEAEEADDSAAA